MTWNLSLEVSFNSFQVPLGKWENKSSHNTIKFCSGCNYTFCDDLPIKWFGLVAMHIVNSRFLMIQGMRQTHLEKIQLVISHDFTPNQLITL